MLFNGGSGMDDTPVCGNIFIISYLLRHWEWEYNKHMSGLKFPSISGKIWGVLSLVPKRMINFVRLLSDY